jgi:hypothetical protein
MPAGHTRLYLFAIDIVRPWQDSAGIVKVLLTQRSSTLTTHKGMSTDCYAGGRSAAAFQSSAVHVPGVVVAWRASGWIPQLPRLLAWGG